MNIQDWFPLGWTGWISLQSKGLSRVFSSTTIWKHQFFSAQPSLWSTSHIHIWLLEKPKLWLYGLLSAKCYLCFVMSLSRFVIAFLPRSKHLLISLLTGFWTKFDKLILKYIWKNKGPKVIKKILKNKNKEGDILSFQISRFIIELWSLKQCDISWRTNRLIQ